jgi:hypothetical protein
MGDSGANAIAHMIRHNRVLQRLNLARTGMSDSHRELIFAAIEENDSLIDLTMDGPPSDFVRQRLESNRANAKHDTKPDDIKLIRSVYRTPRRPSARKPLDR